MKFDFSHEAIKAIGRLDANTAGRVFKGIMGLPSKGDIKALGGKHSGLFRLRVGDWRIIYAVNDNVVSIGCVLPRGDAY